MRGIHYFFAGLGVALALTISVALIVRNLPAETPVPEQQETASPEAKADLRPPSEMIVAAAPPAVTAPPPAIAAPPIAIPPPAVTTSLPGAAKPANPFDPESLPSPGYIGPDRPALTPPQAAAPGRERPASESRGVPIGSRLNLTTEQADKLRYVLLTHTIMQSEAPEFPLRIGGNVPPEVSLMPLPREVADAVPGYRNYSYVISQYQIVIVVTERREIDLLLPTG
jgi:hypothetical protein